MDWLEHDYRSINQKNKLLFLNKAKTNSNPNIFNCYLYNETNNPNQDLFYLTDLKLKLKVKLNPKRIQLIKTFYTNQVNNDSSNNNITLIKIYLKKIIYSTLINFRSSKDPFIFLIIDDFDISKSQEESFVHVNKLELAKLTRWDHIMPVNQNIPQLDTISLNNNKSNLSILIDNLSQPESSSNYSNYTIEIKENLITNQNKKNLDLNEAFANETNTTTSTSSSNPDISNNQILIHSFINTGEPKCSSQIQHVNLDINYSNIKKSSITITKINNLTDDDDDDEDEVLKTFQFSPRLLCDTHSMCVRDTQSDTINNMNKKRRKLLDDKCANELLMQDVNLSLISNESEVESIRTSNRSLSTCSSTSSSSLSLSSCNNTPKSCYFRPKTTEIKSEPRQFYTRPSKSNNSRNSHLIFSPLKTNPERKEKLREIKKNFLSNRSIKLLNSPAKLNSQLVDKILNFNNKNIMSSDEDDFVFDETKSVNKTLIRRRKLLFDKNNQIKELDKVFDVNSVNNKSIPSAQNPPSKTNSILNTSDSTTLVNIQSSLLDYKFVSNQTENKLQEYLINLAEMTKSTNTTISTVATTTTSKMCI
ncbi:unnamed protein product [Brachionus calyciflorus]|uniref:Uncharacterized protein n=1 Tax=Brachionus calyciflorus TaxID=104777 RepID=A0A813YM70_9BILA|nr:unnamed protein product [Brachionus calyciflorus]